MKQGDLIFGTDGVRDRAGTGLLVASEVRRLIQATAWTLRRTPGTGGGGKTVLIGRDTRSSGADLSLLIRETFSRAGFPVLDLGVIPTPGVARLTASHPEAVLGVVVSASHNPAEYNGIKYLSPGGSKASRSLEKEISGAFWRSRADPEMEPAPVREDPGAVDRYVKALLGLARRPDRLAGKRVAMDAAHGATHEAAPRLFRELGAEVVLIGARPDGRNINAGCGALHPGGLARAVKESGAALGFCFDGDGDRMVPVARDGSVFDGDHVLFIAGRHYHARGDLPGKTVVATDMSNLGLEMALRENGLRLLRTPVGDRHVYEAMVEGGHPIGGEQSGHLIFLDDARTGDGILAALRLVDCLESDGLELEEEARAVVHYPQILLNYHVPKKIPFDTLPRVGRALREAEAALDGQGRIVLRYSGTEPVARVMIEGPERSFIESLARKIGEEIQASIPGA